MRVRKVLALVAALGFAATIAFMVAGTAAAGTINQVTCPLPGFNPTHFGIEEGTTVTCTVDAIGVTSSPATIDVIIRSSSFGNTTVTGTLVSGTTYEFTYTAPAQACNTSNIGYQQAGGTPKDAHAGFAFLSGGELDSSCGAPPPAPSAVTTAVHLGASDSSSPVVVDNAGPAPLGSKVHDSAKLTIANGVAAPAGSTVTFLFFRNNDCTGMSADEKTVAADGVSPVVLDPGLVEPASGGLEAGGYSFQAFFTSGDSTKVQDADGDCEPFKVDQGNTSTATALKNAADESPIADGSLVALGTSVHDTATVSGSPFTPTGTVTYRFYVAKDCGGLAVSEQTVTLNADGSVPASAATPALHPGDYGFIAGYSGDGNYRGSIGDCEPFSVDQGDTATATALKNAADESAIADGSTVPLGTSVHDTATVSGSPFTPTGTVTYHFFIGKDCAVSTAADETVTLAADGSVPNSSPTVALHPGDYGFKAEYSGDDNYRGSTSDCEPFTVALGTTQTTTQVHDAGHNDITGRTVPNGSFVHDSATVTRTPAAFPLTGTVTYQFFGNGTCSGTALSAETVMVGSESTPQQLSSGAYSYLASYNGSADYKASTGVCEPFAVRTPGKTMGFWGNKNGQARIAAAGGYAANAVMLGRGSNIDTSAESLKVLPNSLNACGKGTPQIFSVGGSTSSANCTVASGVNVNSLNTLASQTLALGYNLNPALLPGFGGQTVGGMGCGLAGTGLSPTSSVSVAFAAAVALINGSAAGGSTTQAQIGAMNSLLGCVNSEA